MELLGLLWRAACGKLWPKDLLKSPQNPKNSYLFHVGIASVSRWWGFLEIKPLHKTIFTHHLSVFDQPVNGGKGVPVWVIMPLVFAPFSDLFGFGVALQMGYKTQRHIHSGGNA